MIGLPRDLSPAVIRAVTMVEMVVEREREAPGGERIFDLVGTAGLEGTLRAEASAPHGADLSWRRTPAELTLTARIGAFGDAAREDQLLTSVERELRALAPRE